MITPPDKCQECENLLKALIFKRGKVTIRYRCRYHYKYNENCQDYEPRGYEE